MPDALAIFLGSLLTLLWTVWWLQAALMVPSSRKFSRRVGRPLHPEYAQLDPPAVVIVPFKGVDHDLAHNVRGMLTQEYPDYRLVFVLESNDDPAFAVINLELDRLSNPPAVDFVFAGIAPPTVGQKVHNQIAALDHIESVGIDMEVWVFADSDAAPGKRWLHHMVGPLYEPDTGVSTGYRWLVPQLRAQRPHLGGMIASVINAGVATIIITGRLTQAWGGSMAMKSAFAKEQNLRSYFEGAISDDYQVTQMCRNAGKRIFSVPECLVASPIEMTFGQMWEFIRRQYLIVRVHHPATHRLGLLITGLYVTASLSAWTTLITSLCTSRWLMAFLSGSAIVIVTIANQIRATYRRQGVREAFGRDMVRYMRHTLRLDRFGTLPVFIINFAILLHSSFGHTLTWRGKRYRLNAPQDVKLEASN